MTDPDTRPARAETDRDEATCQPTPCTPPCPWCAGVWCEAMRRKA